MAQISRTTSGMGGVSIDALNSSIASLKTLLLEQRAITASSTAALKALLITWAAHTHSVEDRSGIDTAGNVTKYTTAGKSSTVTTTVGLNAANFIQEVEALNVATGNQILATDQHLFKRALDALKLGHAHNLIDTES